MNESAHEDFERFVEGLKQQRDELKLQLHLLKADARDEWEAAEKKWKELKAKKQQFSATAGEIVGELEDVATALGKDIKQGYERIRRHLK